jgi:hypothetical protein
MAPNKRFPALKPTSGVTTLYRCRAAENSFSFCPFQLRLDSILSPDPKCYFWPLGSVPRFSMRELRKSEITKRRVITYLRNQPLGV